MFYTEPEHIFILYVSVFSYSANISHEQAILNASAYISFIRFIKLIFIYNIFCSILGDFICGNCLSFYLTGTYQYLKGDIINALTP